MAKSKVLFLCIGNSCRSQIAEAFLRHYGGENFNVHSAGINPKPINPLTIKVMEEKGYDLSGESSKSVNEFAGKEKFDYLITVCDEADKNCPVGLVDTKHRLHWNFEDPAAVNGTAEERLTKFREVRDLIEKKVLHWVSEQKMK